MNHDEKIFNGEFLMVLWKKVPSGKEIMFEQLLDVANTLEEINMQLTEPDVIQDHDRYFQLMKQQRELTPLVEKYQEYTVALQGIDESLSMLNDESDEDMKELAKEELADCRQTVEQCEKDLKLLMLPKDPNDDKNVFVEIRGVS